MAHFECGMNLEKIFQLFPLLWGISGAAATMFQEGFISHPLQITKLFLVQPTSGPFESETILVFCSTFNPILLLQGSQVCYVS